MGIVFHAAARAIGRFTFTQTMVPHVLHRSRGDARGPIIFACTHASHVEPMLLTSFLNRRIEWMARKEFYQYPLLAWTLRNVEAFKVDRQGVSISAIRHALKRLNDGATIGIFPEGGVANGKNSMCCGGPMKAGVCLISQRSGVPIVPVVFLGTEKLHRVDPWLPMRRSQIWINFGRLVYPDVFQPARCERRIARQKFAMRLRNEFERTYRELCSAGAQEFNLT